MTVYFELTKKDRIEKIRENSKNWKESEVGTFEELTSNMKHTLLSKAI